MFRILTSSCYILIRYYIFTYINKVDLSCLNILCIFIASILLSRINRNVDLYSLKYTLERDKQLYTSFYVKSNSNYKKNTNDSYKVNFYNKLDQLQYLEKNPKNNTNVTLRDKRLAENTLILEVKLGYKDLKKTTNKFKQFLDIDLTRNFHIKQKVNIEVYYLN